MEAFTPYKYCIPCVLLYLKFLTQTFGKLISQSDCISYPLFLVNKISQVITAHYERKTVEDYCTLGLPATKFLSFSKQIAVGYVH